jgi:NitT/TauT family transport system ATP-binding protein
VIADVPIDGKEARDEAYRVSAPFLAHCKTLSDLISDAHQLQGA